jgi:HEAT repeat protein/S1-C subfamily serine protease
MITFACPNCDSELEVPDRAAGTKVTCPDCGKRFLVPMRSSKSARRDSRPARKGKSSQESNATPIIIACVGGGIALCVVFGALAFFLLSGKKDTGESPVAQAPPRRFDPPPEPMLQPKPAPPLVEEPALPVQASGQGSGKGVYQHVLKSVAWIIAPHDENSAMTGTGTLVDKTNMLVLTNNHVIRGAKAIYVFFPNFRQGQPIAERDLYLKRLQKQDRISGQVIARDVMRDLALIQLERVPEEVEALAVGHHSADIGDQVHSVGNPGVSGALWVYTSGTVRQVYEKTWRTAPDPEEEGPGGGQRPGTRPPGRRGGGLMRPPPGSGGPQPPRGRQPGNGGAGQGQGQTQETDAEGGTIHRARVVETQSPTNPGDSGGPLVNDHGELVGVTQGGAAGAQLVSLFIDVGEATSFIEKCCKDRGMSWVRETRSLRLGSDPNQVMALLKALEHRDDNVRGQAAQTLGTIGPEAKMSIPGLLRVAREDSKDVNRNLAVDALNKIGPPDRSELTLLRECLKDHDPRIRSYAAAAAGKLGPEASSVMPVLVQVARDGNVEVRQNATRALGKMGTDAKDTVLPVLMDNLKDSDRDVRVAAAQGLTSLEALGVGELPLLINLLKHQDSEARVCAAHALGQLGDKAKKAVPVLVEAFQRTDPALRSATVEALAKIGGEAKDTVPVFTQALGASEKDTRKNACVGLGKVGPDAKSAAAELANLLTDSDVKVSAAVALGKIGPGAKDAVSVLADVLNKDAAIRVEVLKALGEIGPAAKSAVPSIVLVFTIVNNTGRADKAMHALAAKTLGKIGKDAVPDLVRALGNENNLIRVGAAMALGEIGPPARKAAKDALTKHAQADLDPQVREVAGLALSKVLTK